MIAIDGRFIVKNISGIGRYSLGLLQGIANLDPPYKIAVLTDSETSISRNIRNADCFEFIELKYRIKTPANQFKLPKTLGHYKIKVYHVPDGFAPIFPICARLVLTIHDLIPIRCRRMLWSSKKAVLSPLWRRWLKAQCNRASAVVTVSEHSKKDIVDLMNAPPDKTYVIYNGVTIEQKEISKEKVVEKYGHLKNVILYVGRFDPYKNLVALVDAFDLLLKKQIDAALMIVGKLDPRYPEALNRVKKLGLEGKVVFTDYINDEELTSVYAAGSVFAFPSLYEGFGLPPLEAMANGVPVVSSNRTSLPEVLGDAALFVDPTDFRAMAEMLFRTLNDTEVRNSLISKGLERVKMFTWEKSAEEHLKLYESFL